MDRNQETNHLAFSINRNQISTDPENTQTSMLYSYRQRDPTLTSKFSVETKKREQRSLIQRNYI